MERSLAQALVDFDEDFVFGEIKKRLGHGEKPMQLIRELQQGMGLVGKRFEGGMYFLSELIMSADIFARAMGILEPKLEGSAMETIGKIVIGTPKGDIHDIGKNIFCTVAKGAGFEVHDLGVDVPIDRFVETIAEVKPQILGFSALITPAFKPMKEVVDILVDKGLRENIKIIVGGGVVTETVQKFVRADAFTTDAIEGLEFCKSFVAF